MESIEIEWARAVAGVLCRLLQNETVGCDGTDLTGPKAAVVLPQVPDEQDRVEQAAREGLVSSPAAKE